VKHVIGVGGIFLKADDPEKLGAWYREHLGLELQDFGGVVFHDQNEKDRSRQAYTTWAPFASDTDYFAPSTKPFMINFRVIELDTLVAKLQAEGVTVERTEKSEFGNFAWIMDPEGNRVELWEPPPA